MLAGAFRMLDTGSLRVGSERYAAEHGSFGLSTLLCAHATVTGGDTSSCASRRKSGQAWESDIRDADLAALVTRLKRRGGRAQLLAWQDEGGWHPLSAARSTTTCASAPEGTSRRRTSAPCRHVGGRDQPCPHRARGDGPAAASAPSWRPCARPPTLLGNTPAIARGSYIDPRLLDAYESGDTIDPARTAAVESELRALLT